MLVLFETAAGFALFKVLKDGKLDEAKVCRASERWVLGELWGEILVGERLLARAPSAPAPPGCGGSGEAKMSRVYRI